MMSCGDIQSCLEIDVVIRSSTMLGLGGRTQWETPQHVVMMMDDDSYPTTTTTATTTTTTTIIIIIIITPLDHDHCGNVANYYYYYR